jgi:hypothetical protein
MSPSIARGAWDNSFQDVEGGAFAGGDVSCHEVS